MPTHAVPPRLALDAAGGTRSRRPWLPTRRREPYLGAPQRVLGVDAARGLAIFGMVIAHTVLQDPEMMERFPILGFANGHASILFATLTGVAVAIVTGGPTPPEGAELLRKRLHLVGRALALMLVSTAVALLPTMVATILASYAFWFLLVIPALRWKPRTLLIAAVILGLTGRILSQILFEANLRLNIFATAGPETAVYSLLVDGTYPAFTWMPFLLAGMALGRTGLVTADRLGVSRAAHPRRALTIWGVGSTAVAVLAALPFVLRSGSLKPFLGLETSWNPDESLGDAFPVSTSAVPSSSKAWLSSDVADPGSSGSIGSDWPKMADPDMNFNMGFWESVFADFFSMTPHTGTPFEVFSSGAFAIAIICACVALCRVRAVALLLSPLIVLGAASLTAYCMHLVLLAALPEDWQAGSWFFLFLTAAVLAFNAVWRAFFRNGPVETFVGAFADRIATVPVAAGEPLSNQTPSPEPETREPDVS